MRIPIVSDFLDAIRANRHAGEVADAERRRRDAIRKKAATEQRARQAVTDTMLDEVHATTCEISGVVPPRIGPNGRKQSVAELAAEAKNHRD